MFRVHRLMVNEKKSHLSQLEQQLYDVVDNPYDISSGSGMITQRLNRFSDVSNRCGR